MTEERSRLLAERALGGGDEILQALIDLDRLSEGARARLKAAFGDVVIVLAVKVLDVERDARVPRAAAISALAADFRLPAP